MIDNYVLRGSLEISKAISSCLDDELCQDVCAMSNEFRSLATFQFHFPSTKVEELFREMDAVAKRGKIPLLQCPATDLDMSENVSLRPPIPDSVSTIKSLPCIMARCPSPQMVRRSVRLSSPEKGRSKSVQSTRFKSQTGVEAWPTLSVKPPEASSPDALLFIQHVRTKVITIMSYHTLILQAWTRAVESDATFIVFNCGNYERIGFRHRGNQALFLSDLINVSESSYPGYGQIQIGLYMIILRDALDRIRLIKEASTTNKPKKKQSRYIDANREYERPRTRLTTFREQQSEDMHMQSVMNISHSSFNSPLILVLDSALRNWSQESGITPVKIWSVRLSGTRYFTSHWPFTRKSIASYYKGAKI